MSETCPILTLSRLKPEMLEWDLPCWGFGRVWRANARVAQLGACGRARAGSPFWRQAQYARMIAREWSTRIDLLCNPVSVAADIGQAAELWLARP